jgi:hypothetical protein
MKSKAPGPSLVKGDSGEQCRQRVSQRPEFTWFLRQRRILQGKGQKASTCLPSNAPRAAGQVDTVVPFGSVKVWLALQNFNNFKTEETMKQTSHFHIGMNAFDGASNITQCTIHDCLGSEELLLGNDSARLKIRDSETRTP